MRNFEVIPLKLYAYTNNVYLSNWFFIKVKHNNSTTY